MVTYIYFVKCPNSEDEHFDFFDEAKEFALGCLGQKPIITQTEVCRNDFGECTDSADLGTVWSWEDIVGKETDAEPTTAIFSKDDFKDFEGDYNPENDPEFYNVDNSVDSEPVTSEVSAIDGVPDNFRKPIPEGMTIEQLVEEMEENEDTVECTWCNDFFDKSECRKEVDLGWLCSRCEMAIKSRGETLTFKENNYWDDLDEDFKEEYDLATLVKDSINHLTNDLGKDPWADDFADDVIADIENNYDVYVPDDMEKYSDWCSAVACEVSRQVNNPPQLDEEVEPESVHDLGNTYDGGYPAEDSIEISKLDELEEATTYRKRLGPCPECGIHDSFDHETGMCLGCGFNI